MRLIPRCYNGNKILDDTIDKRFSGWNRAVNNTVRGLSSNPLGKYLLNHRNTAYELGKDAYINQLSNPVQ